MKVRMQSKVKSITRLDNETTLELDFVGKEVLAEGQTASAKKSLLKGTLTLRTAMADDLKVGSVFTIYLNDSEPADPMD